MSLLTPATEQLINTLVCSNPSPTPATQVAGPSASSAGSGTFVFVWEGMPPSDSELRVLGAVYQKSPVDNTLNEVTPACDSVVTISSFGGQAQPSCAMNARKRFGV